MALTLYMIPHSPPVRSVQITAKALGIQLQEKQLDFSKGDHTTPEYLKINPQHTVPTLVEDDGFTIWESHAINAYLVSKYSKDNSLYPKDLKKRAVVDQRLHFNSGVAFARGIKIVRSILNDDKTSINDQDKESLNEVYQFLEAFLDGKPWIAGDSKTIADYHLYATITADNVLVPIDGQKYPKLTAWIRKVNSLPEAEASKKGLEIFKHAVTSKLHS